MTQDLESRTRHYYTTVDAGDVAGVVEWFAAGATYYRPGYEPLVGRHAIADFYADERVIESGHHTLDRILVSGSSVAVRGHFDGVLKNGTDVGLGFADFIRYDEDGHAVERHSYFETPAV